MKKRKEIIIIFVSLLVVVLSVSVAYFTTRIVGTGKPITTKFTELKITFTNGDGSISATNIEPGWSSNEKTFTVKNESNGTYKYNIIIKDLINTFVTEGFLVYKITSADGGYNMTEYADVPKSYIATDTVLAENISINKDAIHTYKIEIKYLESSTINQDEDQGKKLSGKIFIEKHTESGFRGYLAGSLGERILNNNLTIDFRSDFSTPFTSNTVNTLYKSRENGTDVYYFAGQDITSTPINNWVKFGKNSSNQDLYWRIIRTNADGSIRLLYHGTSTSATDAYIGTSKFNENSNDSMYVGYMYGTSGSQESNRTNTNNSTIKTAIDNWYASNMTSYTKYLSTTAVYCNDREVGSGTYSATGSEFYYATYTRLFTNKTPTYDCTNDNDKFTVDASTGNGKLTYPIALMTADEIAYAGGVAYTNAPMWYYTNSTLESSTGTTKWWSLSPGHWVGGNASSWRVDGSDYPGHLVSSSVDYSGGVRPVVSLKACTLWTSGNGTPETPYEIALNGGC